MTVIREAGTNEELRREMNVGGDFRSQPLFDAQDKIQPGDEVHSDLFDEPRVIMRVEPVLGQTDLLYWIAEIIPRSEWRRRYKTAPPYVPGRAPYPRTMYHSTKPPVQVNNSKAEAALGPSWSAVYLPRYYPKCKYHWNGKTVTVKDVGEEIALGGGWADTPADFEPYKSPRRTRPDRSDPIKWVEEWSVAGISPSDRIRIKAQLKKAHGTFWKSPNATSALSDAMHEAFNGIAKVLFEAGILTDQLLAVDLPTLIWDSAISGGWWHLASDRPQTIFPERLGHYWVWFDEGSDWHGLFRSEIATWEGTLLEASVESELQASPAADDPNDRNAGGAWSTEEVAASVDERNSSQHEKGDLQLLAGANGERKRVVTLDTACRYGGVSKRAIQKALRKGALKSEGEGPNRRVLVQSLLDYFPPENSTN